MTIFRTSAKWFLISWPGWRHTSLGGAGRELSRYGLKCQPMLTAHRRQIGPYSVRDGAGA